MLDYNRIAYELDGLKAVPDDVEGLSILQHFDYPETWSYNGSTEFSESAKFGKGCVYFPDATSSVSVTNTTGIFNLHPEANYEFEAFVKLAGTDADANILSLGGLVLAVTTSNTFQLTSTDWGINSTPTTELTPNIWYHLLLRISGQYITLYVDGTQALSEAITGSDTLKPEAVTLGGYVGYMDEFAFRRNAGSSTPTVPTTPYDTNVVIQPIEVLVEVPSATTNNAPVSRAAWSCANLPEGLTLSSAGVLSGHPTTAGTYECLFTVTTNWGIDSKTINIVVQ